jgi:hypothetical protein
VVAEPNPDSETLTNEERVYLLKYLAAFLAFPCVIGVTAPLLSVYLPEGWKWVSVVVIVALLASSIRGVHALVYPTVRAANPRAVALGVATAVALLLAAPESLRLSYVNYSAFPILIYLSVIGVLLAAVFLFFVWRTRGFDSQPPNTSFERTREG